MTYERDPLSVQFDRQAKAVITLVIAQHGKHRENTKLVPYVRVRVPNPARSVGVRESGKDHLSSHERAFLRSLYHDDRIHQLTARRKPHARWSLKAEWGPVPVLAGQARYVSLRVFTATDGSRHMERKPASVKFSETPELRSTYAAGEQEAS